jgi:hypothetical protein
MFIPTNMRILIGNKNIFVRNHAQGARERAFTTAIARARLCDRIMSLRKIGFTTKRRQTAIVTLDAGSFPLMIRPGEGHLTRSAGTSRPGASYPSSINEGEYP